MDRDFRTPQDVARATPDRVEQCLVKILRRGVEGRPFFFRLRFEYQGGKTQPLLYIGTLNRDWSDYIDGNARAIDMATGTCTSRLGETGRQRIELAVTRGRGATESNLLTMNRTLRRLNAEVAFAPAEGEAEAEDGDEAEAASTADSASLARDARTIRERFDAFKAAPSGDGLADLEGLIAEWQAAAAGVAEMAGSKEIAFVEKLAGVLAAKGQAFVAKGAG